MPIKNLRKLKRTVYLMIVLAIITFLSGFLKYTPFEHISLILFFLLFLYGLKLFYRAKKAEINGYLKFFLMLTSLSTIGFILLIAVVLLKTFNSELTLSDNLELLEGLFYLTSLIFLIGAIGSIILLNIKGGRNTSQS